MNKLRRANIFVTSLLLAQFTLVVVVSYLYYEHGIRIGLTQSLIITDIFCFLLPTVVYFALTKEKIKKVFPLKLLNPKNCLYIVALSVLLVPSMQFLSLISTLIAPNAVSEAVSSMFDDGKSIYLLLTLMAAAPAIFEEIVMRGIAYSDCEELGLKRAAILNGLYFAMLHLSIQQFMYTFVLGAVFVHLRYYTKSFTSVMLAHFTINAVNLFLSFAALSAETGQTAQAAESIDIGAVILTYLLIILPVTLGLFFIVYRSFKKYNMKRAVSSSLSDFELKIARHTEAELTLINVTESGPKKINLLTPSFAVLIAVYAVIMLMLM